MAVMAAGLLLCEGRVKMWTRGWYLLDYRMKAYILAFLSISHARCGRDFDGWNLFQYCLSFGLRPEGHSCRRYPGSMPLIICLRAAEQFER